MDLKIKINEYCKILIIVKREKKEFIKFIYYFSFDFFLKKKLE